jgi:hypothetical protein
VWTTQFGTQRASNEVTALSSDTTGIYAAGFVGRSIPGLGQQAPNYLFVGRYDVNGHQVWTQQLGSENLSDVSGLAVGSGGVFVIATLKGDGYVSEYDLNGKQAWTSQCGCDPKTVSVGPSGMYVGGTGPTNSSGISPVILREYDFGGNAVWTDFLGNSNGSSIHTYTSLNGLYVTTADSLDLGGAHTFVSRYEFNGTRAWTRLLLDPPNPNCYCETTGITGDNNGVYVSGDIFDSLGHFAGFIRKLDLIGNQLWLVRLPPPDYSAVERPRISADPSGVYMSTTTFARHTFLSRYDGNGNSVWSFQTQGSGSDPWYMPISVGADRVYVGGSLDNGGFPDAYLASFTQSSSLILFGINPPFSFLLLAAIAGAVVFIIMWQRRRWEKKARTRSANRDYSSTRLPTDPNRPH